MYKSAYRIEWRRHGVVTG